MYIFLFEPTQELKKLFLLREKEKYDEQLDENGIEIDRLEPDQYEWIR